MKITDNRRLGLYIFAACALCCVCYACARLFLPLNAYKIISIARASVYALPASASGVSLRTAKRLSAFLRRRRAGRSAPIRIEDYNFSGKMIYAVAALESGLSYQTLKSNLNISGFKAKRMVKKICKKFHVKNEEEFRVLISRRGITYPESFPRPRSDIRMASPYLISLRLRDFSPKKAARVKSRY